MLKVRLVALTTLLAAGALVFALQTRSKRTAHSKAPRAQTSAVASATGPESAAAPSSSVAAVDPTASNVPAIKDYSVFPDGKPVPELPASAPRTCGFGAILFTYEGAQYAPRKARSKAEAYRLAKELIPQAEQNFVEAAKKGDPGSLADAGSIGRQVLERAVEYQLFTLDKGQLRQDPVETPRGYWVLKRLR